jgi:acetoin utilization deacetylase AcuC-like enzyme
MTASEMPYVFADAQTKHDPKFFLASGIISENEEVPARAEILAKGAEKAGLTRVAPEDYGLGVISRCHTPEYLQFLKNIYTRWSRKPGAPKEVIPNIHPQRRDFGYPAAADGQVGYHTADTSAPIGAHTWESAYWSAQAAAHAAELVSGGADSAYALCRPPGHHAMRDIAGGFCYLNNSGIAAEELRQRHERVAILDIDVHHGNGTQDIFYERPDVLTVSLHVDPVRFYPFFWGHADERGDGAGQGYNLNIPLRRRTADDDYLTALDQALERIDAFAPGALVLALGLDSFEGDPFEGLSISTPGFARIADAISTRGYPTVIVQEGGYICPELGDNLTSFLTGFTNARD